MFNERAPQVAISARAPSLNGLDSAVFFQELGLVESVRCRDAHGMWHGG